MECSGLSVLTSPVEPQPEIDTLRVHVVAPQQLQAVVDHGQVCVCEGNGTDGGDVAVPDAVDVVCHDVEPVQPRLQFLEVEAAHILVAGGLTGTPGAGSLANNSIATRSGQGQHLNGLLTSLVVTFISGTRPRPLTAARCGAVCLCAWALLVLLPRSSGRRRCLRGVKQEKARA